MGVWRGLVTSCPWVGSLEFTAAGPPGPVVVVPFISCRWVGAAVDPLAAFRAETEAVLAKAFAAVGYQGDVPGLETPPNPAMGDLAVPCFPLAKALRKAPPAIAADVAAACEVPDGGWVAGVAAAGPYVNVRMDGARLAREVLADPAACLTPPPGGEKVLLEHTSANPNGPLHVGRARNPILGDTLTRLFRAAGHDVEAQYYMDNLGRQVALLYWGKTNLDPASLPPAARDKPDHDLVRYYQAANDAMKADPEVAEAVKAVMARLEHADPDLLPEVRKVYEACFSGMKASLERLGVRYDSIKDESDVVVSGAVEEVLEQLKRSPRAGVEEDGANYLDLSDHLKGQKDRFYFTRKDGSSVYATRDVAYHAWKAQRVGSAGRLLNVLGEDHRLQSLQVGVALEELGHRKPDVVFYSFVTLPEGKMSTRMNRVVFLDDLMDEAVERARKEVQARRGDELGADEIETIAEAVGVGAIRFSIERIQPEKPIEFRWEEALDFDGDSGPYLQYAYARAASLLRKAQEAGLSADASAAQAGVGEERFLRVLARFQAAIQEAVNNLAPHRFAAYALELAGAFNEYYRDQHVLGAEDPNVGAMRLAVVHAAAAGLRAALEALGVPVLESM